MFGKKTEVTSEIIKEKIPVVMRNKEKPPGGGPKGKQNGFVKTIKRLFKGKKVRRFGKDKGARNEVFSYDWSSNGQQSGWMTNGGGGQNNLESGKSDENGGGNNAEPFLGNQNGFGSNMERFNPSQDGFGNNGGPFMSNQNVWDNTEFFLANQNGYGNNSEACFTNQNGFGNNSDYFVPNQSGFENNADGFMNYQNGWMSNQNGFGNNSESFMTNQNGFGCNGETYSSFQNGFGNNSEAFMQNGFENHGSGNNWTVENQVINFQEPEVPVIPIQQLNSNVWNDGGSGCFGGENPNAFQPNGENTFAPSFEQCFPSNNESQGYHDFVWDMPPAVLQNGPPPQQFQNFQNTRPLRRNPSPRWNSPNDNRKRVLVVTKRAQTILKSISPQFTNPFLKSGLFGASVLSSASPMYDPILTYVQNGQCYEKFGLMPVNVLKIIRPNQNCGIEDPNIGSHTQMLFHGTHADNIPSILEYGLQCPREWNVGQRFGKGVYFSDRIGKCAHFTFGDRPQPGQTHFIILCEVQLGRVYTAVTGEGSQYHTAAPELPNGYGEIVQYDSVKCTGREIPDPKEDFTVGNVIWPLGPTIENPNITKYMVKVNEFVVYNPAQINIRYIVEVKITEEHYSKGK